MVLISYKRYLYLLRDNMVEKESAQSGGYIETIISGIHTEVLSVIMLQN